MRRRDEAWEAARAGHLLGLLRVARVELENPWPPFRAAAALLLEGGGEPRRHSPAPGSTSRQKKKTSGQTEVVERARVVVTGGTGVVDRDLQAVEANIIAAKNEKKLFILSCSFIINFPE